MIYRDTLERKPWEVRITHHAFIRAMERGITPEMVEAVIKGGKIRKFGKNMIKFMGKYKRGKVICVGEKKEENRIKILTVEWG